MMNTYPPERIRAIRARLRLTQEEFAHQIGVTFSTVNRWENKKTTPSRACQKLIDILEKRADHVRKTA